MPAVRSNVHERVIEHHEHHEQHIQFYQGPIPPAAELARYEEVLPGAAERIVARFERQSDHRMHLETARVQLDIDLAHKENQREDIGLAVMSILVAGLILFGYRLALYGHDTAAIAFGGSVPLTGFVAVWLRKSKPATEA